MNLAATSSSKLHYDFARFVPVEKPAVLREYSMCHSPHTGNEANVDSDLVPDLHISILTTLWPC